MENRLSVKKTVIGILCVAMLVNSVSMPIYNEVVSNSMVVNAVDTNQDSITIDVSQHYQDETTDNFDVAITNDSDHNRVYRVITIKKSGDYILTGSNQISYDGEDMILDTQIVVQNDVTANLTLNSLTIMNDDGDNGEICYVLGSGYIEVHDTILSPFLIQGTANVRTQGDSKIKSVYTSLFQVEEGGIFDIKQDDTIEEGNESTLNLDLTTGKVVDRTVPYYSDTKVVPTMFSGQGLLSIQSGSFTGTLEEVNPTPSETTHNNSENICFDVANIDISGGTYNSTVTFGNENDYVTANVESYKNTVKVSGGTFNGGSDGGGVTFNGDNEKVSLSGGKYNQINIHNVYYYDYELDSPIPTKLTLNGILSDTNYGYYREGDGLIIDSSLLNDTGKSENGDIKLVVVDSVYVDRVLTVSPDESVTEYKSDTPIVLTANLDDNFKRSYSTIEYQWYLNTIDESSKIEGATESTYEVPNDKCGNFKYICRITHPWYENDKLTYKNIDSNSVSVTVNKVKNTVDVSSDYQTEYTCGESIKNPAKNQLILKDDTAEISYIWKDADGNILDDVPTTAGKYSLTIVAQENETHFEAQKEVDVTLKAHTYGKPTWTWNKDYSSATATFKCTECEDAQVVDATITKTDTEYIATVTFEGETYTDIVPIVVETTTTPATTANTDETTTTPATTANTDETTTTPATTANTDQTTTTPATTANTDQTTTTSATTSSTSGDTTTTSITTTSVSEDTTTSQSTEVLRLGDVDLNGKITTKDLLLIKRYLLNMASFEDGSQSFINADINQNGKVTTADLIALKKYLLTGSHPNITWEK